VGGYLAINMSSFSPSPPRSQLLLFLGLSARCLRAVPRVPCGLLGRGRGRGSRGRGRGGRGRKRPIRKPKFQEWFLFTCHSSSYSGVSYSTVSTTPCRLTPPTGPRGGWRGGGCRRRGKAETPFFYRDVVFFQCTSRIQAFDVLGGNIAVGCADGQVLQLCWAAVLQTPV
jgi:hypothetical protein